MMITKVQFVFVLYLATALRYANAALGNVEDISMREWKKFQSDLTSNEVLPNLSALFEGLGRKWVDECVPSFKNDKNMLSSGESKVSNYELMKKENGVCLDYLSCAYERCIWPYGFDGELPFIVPEFDETDLREVRLNLPSLVVFPKSVGDIKTTIDFANKHKIGISIKSTGHDNHGGSTQKDTINIYMRDFPVFASGDNTMTPSYGIVECNQDHDKVALSKKKLTTQDLVDVACKVAESRSKKAMIHVGGGQVWNDVLKAVHKENLRINPIYPTYQVISGSSGSVGCAGGFILCGGVSGNTPARQFGTPLDNIVQLEMVLPTGHHVRFGPTDWTMPIPAGKITPQTTEVLGWCNSKPNEVEVANWEWVECSGKHIPNFDDLWFAVRGGGGGSYGVITALYYVLHEASQLELVGSPGTIHDFVDLRKGWLKDIATRFKVDQVELPSGLPPQLFPPPLSPPNSGEAQMFLDQIWVNFLIDLYENPKALGLTDEAAYSCGSAGNINPKFFGPINDHICHSDGVASDIVKAWNIIVINNEPKLKKFKFSDAFIDLVRKKMIVKKIFYDFVELTTSRDDNDSSTIDGTGKSNPFQMWTNDSFLDVEIEDAPDTPHPFLAPYAYGGALIPPKSVIMKDREKSIEFFGKMGGWYTATGGKLAETSDGRASYAKRDDTGSMYLSVNPPFNFGAESQTIPGTYDTFWSYIFDETGTGVEDEFPAVADLCHSGHFLVGPKKDDWRKGCDVTFEFNDPEKTYEALKQARKDCISWQQLVWGKQSTVDRLKCVQKKHDPNRLFICWGCIVEPIDDDEEDDVCEQIKKPKVKKSKITKKRKTKK